MEGYFHGGQGKDSIKSLKPRDGQWMDKPAAPPRLRAFVQVVLFPFPFSKVLYLFKSDTNFIIGNCSEEPGAVKRNCSHFPRRLDYEALVG